MRKINNEGGLDGSRSGGSTTQPKTSSKSKSKLVGIVIIIAIIAFAAYSMQ